MDSTDVMVVELTPERLGAALTATTGAVYGEATLQMVCDALADHALVSTDDVMEIVGVSRRSLYNYYASQNFPRPLDPMFRLRDVLSWKRKRPGRGWRGKQGKTSQTPA